jgi:hypothetical protein
MRVGPLSNPTPEADAAAGPPMCVGCAARELAVAGCRGCAAMAEYVHLVMELNELSHQAADTRALRKASTGGNIVSIVLLAVMLLIAWLGVRSPLAYVSVLFTYAAFSCVAGELLVWLGRRRTGRMSALLRERLGVDPSAPIHPRLLVLVLQRQLQVPNVPPERPE